MKKKLIGCKLINIGRAMNLVWMIFSQNNIEYSFHIQCPWRIVINNNIMISNVDLYENENGTCIFDEKIDKLKKLLIDREVTNITINDYYDIDIKLDDDSIIDVFVNDYEECWRFFKKGSIDEEHQVVYANRMEYE